MTLRLRKHLPELAALLMIMGLATLLRLGWPGTIEFLQDEANFSKLALDLTHGRNFPLLSIDSSVGIRNPPMTVYIMAIPYLLTTDPVIATAFVGLMGVLAVLAFYGLIRHYYGVFPAILGGFLMAANPWLVRYSRAIWDVLPLFLILFLATGLLGFVSGKRWAQLWHLPLLSVIGQIHYATVALIPITIVLLIVRRQKITREFWLSVILTVLITLPFLIGAAREGYFSVDTLRKLGNQGQTRAPVTLSGEAMRNSLLMISGVEVFYPPGQQRYSDDTLSYPDSTMPILIVVGLLLIPRVFLTAIRVMIRRDDFALLSLCWLLCLLTTPILFSVTWTTLHTHYLLPVIPAAIALLASGFRLVPGVKLVRYLGEGANRVPVFESREGSSQVILINRVIIGILVFVMVATQTNQIINHLTFVDVTPTPGVFVTPLRYLMPARQALLDQKPSAVLATVEGQYVGYHTEASVWDVLLYDIPVRRFADDNIEVYPAQPTPFLSHRCGAVKPTVQYWYFRGGEGCLSVEMRSRADYPAADFTSILETNALENGITPFAYRWSLSPRPCLALAWEPTHPVPEEWQVKVHWTDAGGKVIAYGDGEFWRGRYWLAGDLIVRTHCLPDPGLAAQITGIRVGMYRQVDGQFINLNFVDEAGAAVGQELVIGLNESLSAAP